MIVDLGCGVYLNPSYVVSVSRDYYGKHILVTDVHGHVHEIDIGSNETAWQAETRIVTALTKTGEDTDG